jgi:SulP family sulfate permease
LAVVVQYLPLPAVGGYLSYVGYFCFASGLGLGCGIQLDSIASWAQLWDKQVRWALAACCVAAAPY